MKKQGFLVSFSLILFLFNLFQNVYAAYEKGNVILLMLDGVRWQEVFNGIDPALSKEKSNKIFTNLWDHLIPTGIIFGDVKNEKEMLVGNNENISLPAYQSIMSGKTQPCFSNECSHVGEETVQERILRELKLNFYDVATIASWKQIPFAVEHKKGTTFTNAGVNSLDDGSGDKEIRRINKEQAVDIPPWEAARYDKYTYTHAIHYLKKHKPRFMFISLNDSDEWGHKADYPQYLKTLRQYDSWIQELVDTLATMNEYGKNTTLIITTDHGRGDLENWRNHGKAWPESKYVWLFATGAGIRSNRGIRQGKFLLNDVYTHLDIRPTIEAAIGLKPNTCEGCGKIIRQLIR